MNEILLDLGNSESSQDPRENLIIDTIHVLKQGTLETWLNSNAILKLGEIAIVSNVPGVYKTGDGTKEFYALPWRGAVKPIWDGNNDAIYDTPMEEFTERENRYKRNEDGYETALAAMVNFNIEEFEANSIMTNNFTIKSGGRIYFGETGPYLQLDSTNGNFINIPNLSITNLINSGTAEIKNLTITSDKDENGNPVTEQSLEFNTNVMNRINSFTGEGKFNFIRVSSIDYVQDDGNIYIVPHYDNPSSNERKLLGYYVYSDGPEEQNRDYIKIESTTPSDDIGNLIAGTMAFTKLNLNDIYLQKTNDDVEILGGGLKIETRPFTGGSGGPGIHLTQTGRSQTILTQDSVYQGGQNLFGHEGYISSSPGNIGQRYWSNVINPFPVGYVLWTFKYYSSSEAVCQDYGGGHWVRLSGFFPYAAAPGNAVRTIEDLKNPTYISEDGGTKKINLTHMPAHNHALYSHTFSWGTGANSLITGSAVSMSRSGNEMMKSRATGNELITDHGVWNKTYNSGYSEEYQSEFWPVFKHMYCWVRVN